MGKHKENRPSQENKDRDVEWMTSADHHLHTTEWFGAGFFYVINLGSKSLNEIASESNKKRNQIVGYFVQLFAFLLMLFLLYIFFIKP